MNDLCVDIGYLSVNHFGEELCGDHVDVVKQSENSSVLVLADGIGSGVKASILSTLTSKIISSMMAHGLSLEDCVSTIADTLPVDKEKDVAYSTFTIISITDNEVAEVIQYENPNVLLIRGYESIDYPKDVMNISGKNILKSTIHLQENDVLVAMSDGCPYANDEPSYNYNWKESDIADFMEMMAGAGYTAKNLSTLLVEECVKLYGDKPRDDVTACVIKVRKRNPMNILFGPPSNRYDVDKMLDLFFSKQGKHIICGGTTASVASKWLRKPVRPLNNAEPTDIPPMSSIDGVDLVTEGVVTMNRVVEYAKDYVGENTRYEEWNLKRNGAALISRMLFEEATDINFYVGKAINPAHQNPDLPITFNLKMTLVEDLCQSLELMGKRVKVSYF